MRAWCRKRYGSDWWRGKENKSARVAEAKAALSAKKQPTATISTAPTPPAPEAAPTRLDVLSAGTAAAPGGVLRQLREHVARALDRRVPAAGLRHRTELVGAARPFPLGDSLPAGVTLLAATEEHGASPAWFWALTSAGVDRKRGVSSPGTAERARNPIVVEDDVEPLEASDCARADEAHGHPSAWFRAIANTRAVDKRRPVAEAYRSERAREPLVVRPVPLCAESLTLLSH